MVQMSVAFLAGFLVHSIFFGAEAPAESGSTSTDTAAPSVVEVGARHADDKDHPSRSGEIQNHDGDRRYLSLSPVVVDAILSGGPLDRMLSRMGFSDEQVSAIETIKTDGIRAFMLLEKERAKLISDDRGEYIEIPAFPVEQKRWLEGLIADLEDVADDGRAEIIARMIMFTDNDEAVGFYRREVFITDPPEGDERMRIEERTFNEDDRLIDTDYDLVLPNSQEGRWGHLLSLGGESPFPASDRP